MTEVVGYAILSGSGYCGEERVHNWRVYAVTSLARTRVYYKNLGSYQSATNCAISELVAFRKTRDEADALLAEIHAELKDKIDAYVATKQAAEDATAELRAAAKARYEAKPGVVRSTPAKLKSLSDDELKAELARRGS